MNFQLHDNWVVHFIEADCKSTIGRRTRYFEFAIEEGFRTFVSRCNLENMDKFERAMRYWARRQLMQPHERAVPQAENLSIRRKCTRHLCPYVPRPPFGRRNASSQLERHQGSQPLRFYRISTAVYADCYDLSMPGQYPVTVKPMMISQGKQDTHLDGGQIDICLPGNPLELSGPG
jgi:hypothetical protein